MQNLLLVTNVLVVAALVITTLLVRKYFPTYLGKKGENLATKEDIGAITEAVERVKTTYASQLEHLKLELDSARLKLQEESNRRVFEHQARFSWYHERRMHVIADVYRNLDITADRVRDLVSPLQFGTHEERVLRHRETRDQYNELAKAYFPHKIFLDEDICERLDEVVKTIRMALLNWSMSQSEGFKQTKEGLVLWSEASKTMEKEVPAILQELEKRFRQLISSNDPAA